MGFCYFTHYSCCLRINWSVAGGYSLGGCLVSIFVGFIGAYLGVWLAGQLGLPQLWNLNIEGKPFPVIWSVIGSALFTLVIAFLRRAFLGAHRRVGE